MPRRLIWVTALILSGCGGSQSTDATSLPQTDTEAAAGREYRTTGFLGGALTLRPERGWRVLEDSEMHLSAAAGDPNYRVLWSIDARPVRGGRKVAGVPSTANALVRWLEKNPNLRVAEQNDSTVGSRLAAKVIDVSLGAGAANDDPGCPARVCVNFLRFDGAAEPYGIAGDDTIRFYLADLTRMGKRHLLIVSVEAHDQRDLRARLPAAERLIQSAELAVEPAR